MNKYNEQYYLLFNSAKQPSYLKPLRKTVDRDYEYKKLQLAGGPAFFENAYKEENRKAGIKQPIYDLMDSSGHYLISDRLYEKMKHFDIANMQFFPAVFIDDDDQWHENYVLTNYYDLLDCLDIENSTITELDDDDDEDDDYEDDDYEDDDEDDDYEEEELHIVKEFCLSEKILDKIPEEQRLIFSIAKTTDTYIFVHQKIKDIFDQENATGAMFKPVIGYVSGDEY